MKHILNLFFLCAVALLTACSKDESEPEYTPLTIHRQFNAETMAVKLPELKDYIDYKDKMFIVNSPDELPDDKFFSNESFRNANINFSKYSLIIVYQIFPGDIVSYQYGWSYNNREDSYQFIINYDRIKDSQYEDGELRNFTFIRSAILVSHIPSDSKWILASTGFSI